MNIKHRLIFLGAPYSHKDESVTDGRMKIFCRVVEYLINQGALVHSPLLMHMVRKECPKIPGTWEYWESYAQRLMVFSDLYVVIKLEGWDSSVGVKGELELAKKCKLPIMGLTFGTWEMDPL